MAIDILAKRSFLRGRERIDENSMGYITMKASIKRFIQGLALAVTTAICIGGYFLWQVGLIAAAYKAKVLCSGIFISKRDPDSVLSQELFVDDLSILRFFNTSISYDEQSVTASFLGLAKRKAIFRNGLGCTLVIDSTENEIRSQANPFQVPVPPNRQDRLWPEGERVETDRLPTEIDEIKLKEALDAALAEQNKTSTPASSGRFFCGGSRRTVRYCYSIAETGGRTPWPNKD